MAVNTNCDDSTKTPRELPLPVPSEDPVRCYLGDEEVLRNSLQFNWRGRAAMLDPRRYFCVGMSPGLPSPRVSPSTERPSGNVTRRVSTRWDPSLAR
jgi:hypothetical protein